MWFLNHQLPTLTRLSCRKGFLVVVVVVLFLLLLVPCHSRPGWPHMVTLNLRTLICLLCYLCLFCLIFDEGSYKLTSFVCWALFLLDSDCSHPQASNSNRDAHVYHHSSIISSNFSGCNSCWCDFPTRRPQVFRMPRDVGKPRPPATALHGSRSQCYGWVWVGEPMGGLMTMLYCTLLYIYKRWTYLIIDLYRVFVFRMFIYNTYYYVLYWNTWHDLHICSQVWVLKFWPLVFVIIPSAMIPFWWNPALEEIWGWNTLKHDPPF